MERKGGQQERRIREGRKGREGGEGRRKGREGGEEGTKEREERRESGKEGGTPDYYPCGMRLRTKLLVPMHTWLYTLVCLGAVSTD